MKPKEHTGGNESRKDERANKSRKVLILVYGVGMNRLASVPAFRNQGQERMPKNRRKFSSLANRPRTHSGQANKHEKAQLQKMQIECAASQGCNNVAAPP